MSARRIAILIGNSKFPNEAKLAELRLPSSDVDGLKEVLESKELCGFSLVIPLKEEPSNSIKTTIAEIIVGSVAEDLLLVYYSGHGKVDLRGRLYLATNDTRLPLLPETSIAVEQLLDRLSTAKSKQKILILDCCYSGAVANAIFKGDEITKEVNRVTLEGTCVLTSSTDLQPSIEKIEDLYSLMTKHVIEGIRDRKAVNQFGLTSLSDLYTYVRRAVTAESEQIPTMHAKNIDPSEWIIAGSIGKEELSRKKIRFKLVELDDQMDQDIADEANRLARLRSTLTRDQREKLALLSELTDGKLSVGDLETKWDELNAYQKRIAEFFDAAEEAETKENWNEAERLVKNIIEIDPEHVEAGLKLEYIQQRIELSRRYVEATQLLAAEKLPDALTLLQALEAASPSFRDVPNLIEVAQSKLATLSQESAERKRLVIEAEATKRRQRELASLYDEGCNLFDAGNWNKALKRFAKLESLSPNYRQVRSYLEEIRLFIDVDGAGSETPIDVLAALRDQLLALPVRDKNVSKVAERVRAINTRIESELLSQFKRANHLYDQKDWNGSLAAFQFIQAVDPSYLNVAEWIERINQQASGQGSNQVNTNGNLKTDVTPGTKSKAEVEQLYKEARGLMREEKWHAAIEKLETAARAYPSNAEIGSRLRIAKEQQALDEFYWAGKLHVAARDWQSALNMFSRVMAIDPYYRDVDQLLHIARHKGKQPVVERIKEPIRQSLIMVTIVAFMGTVVIVIIIVLLLIKDSSPSKPVNRVASPVMNSNRFDPTRPTPRLDFDELLRQEEIKRRLDSVRKIDLRFQVRSSADGGKATPLEGAQVFLKVDTDPEPYVRYTNAEGRTIAEKVPCGYSVDITVSAAGMRDYSKRQKIPCSRSPLDMPAITLLPTKPQ